MKNLEKYSGLFFGLCGVVSLSIMCFVEQKWYSIAGIIVFLGFAIWFAYLFGRRTGELDNFEKVIFDLLSNNDAVKMNSITKLISMVERGKVKKESATRISKVVSVYIKEVIKKLLETPKRIANDDLNYPIPNRLTDADIEGLLLLSLIYDKFKIRANLKAVDVTGLDFTKIVLNGADFTGANLSNSYFSDSSLKSTLFTSAYICGAKFFNCRLENSEFNVRAYDEKSRFKGTHFEGANISTLSSKYTRLEGAYIDNDTILPPAFFTYNIKNERNEIERNYDYNGGKYSD